MLYYVNRAFEKLFKEGPVALAKAIARFVYRLYLREPHQALKFRFNDGTADIELDGVTASFHVDTREEFDRFTNLYGEGKIIEDILRNVEEDDVFYDVGANVGAYTCFVAQRLPEGSAIAFEPHPKNVDKLADNLRHNDLSADLCRVALADTTGEMDLVIDTDTAGAGQHSLATDTRSVGNDETLSVDVKEGDSMVRDGSIPIPSVIKIDVEGAELEVLEGLEETLTSQRCRLIYCEVHHSQVQQKTDRVVGLLREHGFDVEVLFKRGEESFIKAVKR